MQTNPENKVEFESISHERYVLPPCSTARLKKQWTARLTSDCRAFADFIFGSMILHFFCVNFIN
jgi:oligosaccharyltransferase complex subunit epsilon